MILKKLIGFLNQTATFLLFSFDKSFIKLILERMLVKDIIVRKNLIINFRLKSFVNYIFKSGVSAFFRLNNVLLTLNSYTYYNKNKYARLSHTLGSVSAIDLKNFKQVNVSENLE